MAKSKNNLIWIDLEMTGLDTNNDYIIEIATIVTYHRGGDGIERELEFLAPARFTLLTERRHHRPWGLASGGAGAA
ncbi:hydantoinase B/oxoprolinase family protein, partial [Methylophaga thalassica]|uniref:hydantoinase B/oxoprolinase family protein n=1 Tax=Methylophaga aminisulfidivorans TaxID=230105 RepID=UPI0024E1BB90